MTGVYRFAPSPNGRLHLGHAYSAMLNDALARRSRGRLLLRIEDIDPTRCRPEYDTALVEDLRWLGIAFETPVRRQSEQMAIYAEALSTLTAMGLTYPSFMSRSEIAAAVAVAERGGGRWPRDPDGAALYPGDDRGLPTTEAERRIASGAPYAVRLKMDAALAETGALSWVETGAGAVAADPAAWGDVILARREMPTSYHLAVVVDDATQGVTDIVRGEDLRSATAVHRVLQRLLDLPAPTYRHHRLIRDGAGRKLAKSAGDTGLAELREAGVTPAEIRRMVGVDDDLAAIQAG